MTSKIKIYKLKGYEEKINHLFLSLMQNKKIKTVKYRKGYLKVMYSTKIITTKEILKEVNNITDGKYKKVLLQEFLTNQEYNRYIEDEDVDYSNSYRYKSFLSMKNKLNKVKQLSELL